MTKSRTGTNHKVLRWIQYALLILGVICVGAWVGSNATLLVWQDWQNWVFDRQIAGQPHSVGAYLKNKEASVLRRPSPPLVVSSVTKRPPPVAINAVLGRIVIPRLELRTIVREGDGQDTLQVAAGHIPGTAFPGQAGNVGVAGHRDTLFRGLRTIRPYDVIQFQTLNSRFYYQVESTQVVKPQDVGVLKPKKYPELTLVTCYPFDFLGSAPDRFIVTARQIAAPADDSATQQEDELGPVQAVPATTSFDSPPKSSASRASASQRGETDDERAPGKKIFTIEKDHSRQLAPGISIGITDTNASDRRVNGWMWLLADRRTIWLRDRSTADPIVFYSSEDGRRHEVRITNVTPNSATGYYRVLPSD